MEQVLKLLKSMQEELRNHGSKMEVADANFKSIQEQMDVNTKTMQDDMKTNQVELKSGIEKKMKDAMQSMR
jgi:hypothetical protein